MLGQLVIIISKTKEFYYIPCTQKQFYGGLQSQPMKDSRHTKLEKPIPLSPLKSCHMNAERQCTSSLSQILKRDLKYHKC